MRTYKVPAAADAATGNSVDFLESVFLISPPLHYLQRKGRECLRLLEEPTSPAGPMVIPASEDSRAVARHARGIPAVPGVAVVSVGCSNASASGGVSAVARSMAVVTLGQCDRFNQCPSGWARDSRLGRRRQRQLESFLSGARWGGQWGRRQGFPRGLRWRRGGERRGRGSG